MPPEVLIDQLNSLCFRGVPGAAGVVIGEAHVLPAPVEISTVPDRFCQSVEQELVLLDTALAAVRADMRRVADKLAHHLPVEELALFDVYLEILDDHTLGRDIRNRVVQGYAAVSALRHVVEAHASHFETMENGYLRERAVDVRDLGRRILSYLQPHQPTAIAEYPARTVLVSDELTPSMFDEIPLDRLVGLVSVRGSSNAHAAILARAMGIPTVMGVGDLPRHGLSGKRLIVDGTAGQVYVAPSKTVLQHYRAIVAAKQAFTKELDTLGDQPCLTLDNQRIALCINTGFIRDMALPSARWADGVGLFRTEMPFMVRANFPSEGDQTTLYRQQLAAFAPRPVTMRTLDVGGDKPLSYLPVSEDNPFLGWRGIRVTLDHPDIFVAQVRAMLRASIGFNNLRIMLPMIASVCEVEKARRLIHMAHADVLAERQPVTVPPIGIMIEVPAAIYQVQALADHVDFLSIGSNDLIQYLLAVDRNNPRVASYYHAFHPAVLKALQHVVDAAYAAKKPVSLCGEMAGDPAAAVLLVAMGFTALSMNATNLLEVKWALRQITVSQARQILAEVIKLNDAQRIHDALKLALHEAGLGKMLSNNDHGCALPRQG